MHSSSGLLFLYLQGLLCGVKKNENSLDLGVNRKAGPACHLVETVNPLASKCALIALFTI